MSPIWAIFNLGSKEELRGWVCIELLSWFSQPQKFTPAFSPTNEPSASEVNPASLRMKKYGSNIFT